MRGLHDITFSGNHLIEDEQGADVFDRGPRIIPGKHQLWLSRRQGPCCKRSKVVHPHIQVTVTAAKQPHQEEATALHRVAYSIQPAWHSHNHKEAKMTPNPISSWLATFTQAGNKRTNWPTT